MGYLNILKTDANRGHDHSPKKRRVFWAAATGPLHRY